MMRYLLFFPSFLPLAEYVCCAFRADGDKLARFDVSERRARIRTTNVRLRLRCVLAAVRPVHVDMRRRAIARNRVFCRRRRKGGAVFSS